VSPLPHTDAIVVAAMCAHTAISGSVDDHGHRLCCTCRQRITRRRRGRTTSSGCIIHITCRRVKYKRQRRHVTTSSSSSSSSPDSPPPAEARPNKLRILLRASNFTLTAPITQQECRDGDVSEVIENREDLSSLPSRKEQFTKFGYVRVPATDASRLLAWKMMSIDRGAPSSQAVDVISGNVRQYDLTATTRVERFKEAVDEWSRIVKELADSVDIDTKSLHVVDPKLLVARPKEGLQPVHFDCARTSLSSNLYSAILYCSNGCLSTALPKFPANDLLSYSHIPAEMQSVAHLLERDQYESLPVQVGDMVLFRQSTPHFGVQNDCARDNRIVLFSILSHSSAANQDAGQVFPWLYTGEAFSWNSEEFARSLVENKQYQPISRIRDDVDPQSSLACEKLLSLFDLLSAYKAK
jgi:hypothetical protein